MSDTDEWTMAFIANEVDHYIIWHLQPSCRISLSLCIVSFQYLPLFTRSKVISQAIKLFCNIIKWYIRNNQAIVTTLFVMILASVTNVAGKLEHTETMTYFTYSVSSHCKNTNNEQYWWWSRYGTGIQDCRVHTIWWMLWAPGFTITTILIPEINFNWIYVKTILCECQWSNLYK